MTEQSDRAWRLVETVAEAMARRERGRTCGRHPADLLADRVAR